MTDTLIFSKQIDDVLSGRANRDTVLILGDVPRMYLPFGVPHFKLAMTQRTLHKIITKHNLDIGIIKRLPALLKKPIFVFQSATEPNALVVVIDATDKDKNAVIVIIHPDRQHQQHRINRIASVYSKRRIQWFNEQIEKDRLLYADKEKALHWSQSAQFQLLGEVTDAKHIKNLSRNLQKVKKNQSFSTLTLNRKKGSDNENQ
tara:strand:- start:1917 stop:2525 length:609 start_codon:yes stop_codon:yes gene_type:complete